MGSNFKFTIQDLMSDDTSGNTANPFWREYVRGNNFSNVTGKASTNKGLVSSAAYLTSAAGGSHSPDAYTQTSMLSISDVMMGSPISNDPTRVQSVQSGLLSAAVQNAFFKNPASQLKVFDALVPSDIAQASVDEPAQSASDPSAASGSNTGAGASITPSSGVPTTSSAPGPLPRGTIPYPTKGVPVLEFVNLVAKQVGKKYVWGAAGTLTNTPGQYDCSGLVMWALSELGISIDHFTGAQYQTIVKAGLTCTIDEAFNTCGALLFVAAGSDPAGEHVAISLGNNKTTVEAADPQLGVIFGNVRENVTGSSSFDVAGFVPGLDYSRCVYGLGISTVINSPAASSKAAQQSTQRAKTTQQRSN